MEYLSNWTDTSIIQQTGWSGDIEKGDKCLIFTAKNGWRTFGWSLDSIVGKNICIEFDYIFTDVTNWSSAFIVSNDSIAYGDSYNHSSVPMLPCRQDMLLRQPFCLRFWRTFAPP